jgi:glycosyltransferase involved in cell wall biosynthesis
MAETIHIIEPTLAGESGHCLSFVSSLFNADPNRTFRLWVDRRARLSVPGNVTIAPYFYRKFRRIQAFFLYRRLLREPGILFISTAGRTDFMLLDWASRGDIQDDKVFLFVHWFRPTEQKKRILMKIASRHSEMRILVPTETLFDLFASYGFKNTALAPYPITPRNYEGPLPPARSFSHLLFAGAARTDKGFTYIVDLVERMALDQRTIPMVIQTSPDHYGKYDEQTRADFERLQQANYPSLRTCPRVLDSGSYDELFQGAICLQLYSQQDFSDRISGVTLDALSAGCPVITLSGTWMARVVAEFNAGIVLDSPDTDQVLGAITALMGQFETYRQNAWKAGRELQLRHNAGHLIHELTTENRPAESP